MRRPTGGACPPSAAVGSSRCSARLRRFLTPLFTLPLPPPPPAQPPAPTGPPCWTACAAAKTQWASPLPSPSSWGPAPSWGWPGVGGGGVGVAVVGPCTPLRLAGGGGGLLGTAGDCWGLSVGPCAPVVELARCGSGKGPGTACGFFRAVGEQARCRPVFATPASGALTRGAAAATPPRRV